LKSSSNRFVIFLCCQEIAETVTIEAEAAPNNGGDDDDNDDDEGESC
jgi:hypothetical protein